MMFDANVFLDVFEQRDAHYSDSARALSLVVDHAIEGVVAAHTVTTLWKSRNPEIQRNPGTEIQGRTTIKYKHVKTKRRRGMSGRRDILVAIAGVGMTIASMATAQQAPEPVRYDYGPHMHMMDWNGGWYGMIFGPLFMIAVLTVVIALAVHLVRGLAGPWHGTQLPHAGPTEATVLEILKKRYARGEIDKAEFEERRRVLGE